MLAKIDVRNSVPETTLDDATTSVTGEWVDLSDYRGQVGAALKHKTSAGSPTSVTWAIEYTFDTSPDSLEIFVDDDESVWGAGIVVLEADPDYEVQEVAVLARYARLIATGAGTTAGDTFDVRGDFSVPV